MLFIKAVLSSPEGGRPVACFAMVTSLAFTEMLHVADFQETLGNEEPCRAHWLDMQAREGVFLFACLSTGHSMDALGLGRGTISGSACTT